VEIQTSVFKHPFPSLNNLENNLFFLVFNVTQTISFLRYLFLFTKHDLRPWYCTWKIWGPS